jgi:hypothetical protein
MSDAQHTPGPWTFTAGEYLYVNGKDEAGKRVYITQRDHRFQSKTNQERIVADCRLIAAAPDLLAALQVISNNDPYAALIARAAISKATGSQS